MAESTIGHEVIKSYLYHIRSQDGRGYGKSAITDNALFTQFTVDLYESLTCFDNQSFMVSLASMEFPFSFYTTAAGRNNEINCEAFTTATPGGSGVFTLTFTPGNYDANTFIAEFKTIWDNQFAAMPGITMTADMSYNATTNKFTLFTTSATPGATGRIYFGSNPAPFDAHIQFGFVNANDGVLGVDCVFNTITTPTGTNTSTGVCNVGGPRVDCLYLRTNLTPDHSMESRLRSQSSVLQKIPAMYPFNAFIYYDYAQTATAAWVKRKIIQSVDIRITDGEDNLIDTNLVHFNFTLKFDVVRRPPFLMPDFERRTDTSILSGPDGPYNPQGAGLSAGALGTPYFNTEIYSKNIHDRPRLPHLPVPEGYHVWMQRRARADTEMITGEEMPKRDRTSEEGQTAGELTEEKK